MSHASEREARNQAFDLYPDGDGKVRGVALCIHGLTSTPGEVRPVAEALTANGMRVLGPTLPGHNATPEDLSRSTCTEWLEAVRDEFEKLRGRSEPVFLVGVSLGGLLSLALASEEPVEALAVVGVPLDFGWHRAWLPSVLKYVRPFIPKTDGPDIRDDVARARHVSYPSIPTASVQQLVRLQRTVRRSLSKIHAPILVAYGRHDGTASPARDSSRILSAVSSSERQQLWLEDSGHIATVDRDGPELCAAIASFFSSRI